MTTVRLPPSQIECLHALSEATKVPVAEYVRQGVDLILAKHEKRKVVVRVLTEKFQ